MKLRKAKEIMPDAVPIAVALGMIIYWLSTGDVIKNDPYLLGVFKGVIWSTLIVSHFRTWMRIIS